MKFFMMCVTIWLCIESTNSLRHYMGYDHPNLVNEETSPYHHSREMSPRMSMMRPIQVGQMGLVEHKGYYLPDHRVHLYGMPIYRGEWRATPYYYANGPSYNHYDDRESLSNPLDDLHEEIIQENKQEHQSDMLNDAEYEEYYEEPSESQRDILTNNFLRNMIAYNRHKEMQQEQLRLQQALAQKEAIAQKQALADEPEAERSLDDDYFPDLDINPDEYQYEPKGESNFDIQKYWKSEMSDLANSVTPPSNHKQWESSTGSRNDEDVDELKLLSKQDPEDNSFEEYTVHAKQADRLKENNWESHQQNPENNAAHHGEHDDDYSAFDYDDESWINWDRKRSAFSSRNRALEYKIRKRLSQTFRKDENGSQQNSDLKSIPTSSAPPETVLKTFGQKERLFPDDKLTKSTETPASKPSKSSMASTKPHSQSSNGIDQSIYDTIKQIISIKQELKKTGSKKRKRYVADEASLVNQLDSLRRLKN